MTEETPETKSNEKLAESSNVKIRVGWRAIRKLPYSRRIQPYAGKGDSVRDVCQRAHTRAKRTRLNCSVRKNAR